MQKVRIDKWLWAARFFKTRNLAKQAIDGGKVHIGGHRVKASKEIEIGILLRIRQGWDVKEVEVLALSDQRRSATEAQLLYRETAESIKKRETNAEQRKVMRAADPKSLSKPNTRERKLIHRFKRETLDDN